MKKGRTNKELLSLCGKLKKTKKGIWKRVAELLECANRSSIAVNISKLNESAKEGEQVIVPGKILGAGELKKKVNVAAFAFSQGTKEKIEKAGGKCLTIEQALNENPKGTNARIIG